MNYIFFPHVFVLFLGLRSCYSFVITTKRNSHTGHVFALISMYLFFSWSVIHLERLKKNQGGFWVAGSTPRQMFCFSRRITEMPVPFVS